MFTQGALTFREFMTHDPLPLATIQEAILEFLRERSMLLLTFPDLKRKEGTVKSRLLAAQASAEILQLWSEIVDQEIVAPDDDSEFD